MPEMGDSDTGSRDSDLLPPISQMKLHRLCIPIVLLALSAPPMISAEQPILAASTISLVQGSANTLKFSIGKTQMEVHICQNNLVKVTALREGKPSVDTPSIATKLWPAVQASFDLQADPLVIRTDKMQVKVSRSTGRVSVYDAAGTFLVKEHDAEGISTNWTHGVRFATRPGSHFYGLKGWEYLDDSKGQMEMLPAVQP